MTVNKKKKTSTKKKSLRSSKMLTSISVKLDDEGMLPITESEGVFSIKVGSLSEEMSVPPRTSFVLDCGFDIELPNGVVPIVEANQDWSKRGLILTNNTFGTQKQRFSVIAHNVGRQILAFDHGTIVGRVSFVSALSAGWVLN